MEKSKRDKDKREEKSREGIEVTEDIGKKKRSK